MIGRASGALVALALCACLASCVGTATPAQPQGIVASGSSTEPSPAPTASGDTDAAAQPVEKVKRPGQDIPPEVSAPPASTSEPVAYSDGVEVRITGAEF